MAILIFCVWMWLTGNHKNIIRKQWLAGKSPNGRICRSDLLFSWRKLRNGLCREQRRCSGCDTGKTWPRITGPLTYKSSSLPPPYTTYWETKAHGTGGLAWGLSMDWQAPNDRHTFFVPFPSEHNFLNRLEWIPDPALTLCVASVRGITSPILGICICQMK
jgi:hypothetical protein